MFFFDQISKLLVIKFATHLVSRNFDFAFGVLPGFGLALISLTLFSLLVYLVKTTNNDYFLSAGFGLILGGGVSNLADRVRLGYVVDFLRFPIIPAFNLADTAVVVGICVLLARMIKIAAKTER